MWAGAQDSAFQQHPQFRLRPKNKTKEKPGTLCGRNQMKEVSSYTKRLIMPLGEKKV